MGDGSPEGVGGGGGGDVGDVSALASALAPVLQQQCGGRLGEISWFRASWQSGGAATGYSTFRDNDGTERDVVVKLPVGPAEFRWTTILGGYRSEQEAQQSGVLADGEGAGVTPRCFAAGLEVGGYDLAWLVVEKLGGHPLNHDPSKNDIEDLLRSAAEWYKKSSELREVGGLAKDHEQDWGAQLERAREALRTVDIEHGQHWNDMVKKTQKLLPTLEQAWKGRAVNTWCHGDLHPGNAMRRGVPGANPADDGRGGCVLIDLALVHAGHWVEDAVYLERLHWGRKEMLHGVKPVSRLARFRKDLGLECEDDYNRLANVRRVLMAATSPAYLGREGHPAYLRAALEVLDRLLPQMSS